MKLWGGRFETGPSEVFERFSGSLHFDKRLIQRRYSRVAGVCAGAGPCRNSDARMRWTGSSKPSMQIGADAQQPAFFEGADDEDVHTLVIRKLKERVGGLADKIHTAAAATSRSRSTRGFGCAMKSTAAQGRA